MKKSTVVILVVVIGFLLVMGIGMRMAMNWFAHRASDNIASGILSAATGGKVNVKTDSNGNAVSVKTDDGSMSFGSSATLPSGFPSAVPTPSVGKISGSYSGTDATSGSSYTVAYNLTKTEAATAGATYEQQLKAAGYSIDSTSSSTDESGAFDIFTAQNGTYSVSAVVTSDSSDGYTMTIMVSNQNQ